MCPTARCPRRAIALAPACPPPPVPPAPRTASPSVPVVGVGPAPAAPPPTAPVRARPRARSLITRTCHPAVHAHGARHQAPVRRRQDAYPRGRSSSSPALRCCLLSARFPAASLSSLSTHAFLPAPHHAIRAGSTFLSLSHSHFFILRRFQHYAGGQGRDIFCSGPISGRLGRRRGDVDWRRRLA